MLSNVDLPDASNLGAQIEQGMTLPASWYTDQHVLDLEREAIFKHTWQFAGYLEDVANSGEYLTCDIGGYVPIVVVRNKENELRGFVNVCRHRAAKVVEGCGKRASLQCPYHAWTYTLDGELKEAPRAERENQVPFDKADYGLIPVQVDTWGPFVFVNLDLEAAPLANWMGELSDSLVNAVGADFSSLKRRGSTEWPMEANWKVVAENFLECYHCPPAHPGFSDLVQVDPDNYNVQARGYEFVHGAPLRENAEPPYDISRSTAGGGAEREQSFYLLWPNVTFWTMSGASNLLVYWFVPITPQYTFGMFEYLLGDDADEEFERDFKEFLDQVGREDVALVESVQRGLNSGMVPQGRVFLDSEHPIQHFQRVAYQSLAG